MRQTYIVSYDVSNPRRLRKVFKLMRGYGDHLQLSVFRCELSARELFELRAKLGHAIKHDEDQVLFVDVGPAEGRARGCISALGRPYTHPERHALVV
ncbi:MAG: CRISPR-associated endonuclease Cas2 [Deltaproteobacteria bacterium]|nr:CRISPR-associated endonuclease Cas2 [Deltaproteobacteria bacterium]